MDIAGIIEKATQNVSLGIQNDAKKGATSLGELCKNEKKEISAGFDEALSMAVREAVEQVSPLSIFLENLRLSIF